MGLKFHKVLLLLSASVIFVSCTQHKKVVGIDPSNARVAEGQVASGQPSFRVNLLQGPGYTESVTVAGDSCAACWSEGSSFCVRSYNGYGELQGSYCGGSSGGIAGGSSTGSSTGTNTGSTVDPYEKGPLPSTPICSSQTVAPGTKDKGVSCPPEAENCKVETSGGKVSVNTVIKASKILDTARVASAAMAAEIAKFKNFVSFLSNTATDEFGNWIAGPCLGASDDRIRCLSAKKSTLYAFILDSALFSLSNGAVSSASGPLHLKQLNDLQINALIGIGLENAISVESYMNNKNLGTCQGAACELSGLNALAGANSQVVAVNNHAMVELLDYYGRLVGTQSYGVFYTGSNAKQTYQEIFGKDVVVNEWFRGTCFEWYKKYKELYPKAPFATPALVKSSPELFKECP